MSIRIFQFTNEVVISLIDLSYLFSVLVYLLAQLFTTSGWIMLPLKVLPVTILTLHYGGSPYILGSALVRCWFGDVSMYFTETSPLFLWSGIVIFSQAQMDFRVSAGQWKDSNEGQDLFMRWAFIGCVFNFSYAYQAMILFYIFELLLNLLWGLKICSPGFVSAALLFAISDGLIGLQLLTSQGQVQLLTSQGQVQLLTSQGLDNVVDPLSSSIKELPDLPGYHSLIMVFYWSALYIYARTIATRHRASTEA